MVKSIKRPRPFIILVFIWLLFVLGAAFAQGLGEGWRSSRIDYPAGILYEYAPDGMVIAELQSYPLASLNEASGGSLFAETNDDASLLEESLYIIPVDVDELFAQGVSDSGAPYKVGLGYTEQGARYFATTLIAGNANEQILILYLAEEEAFFTALNETFIDGLLGVELALEPTTPITDVTEAESLPDAQTDTTQTAEASPTPSSTTQTTTRVGNARYPAPISADIDGERWIDAATWAGWTNLGNDVWKASPDDPASPRAQWGLIPAGDFNSFEEARDSLLKQLSVEAAKSQPLQDIEVVEQMLGGREAFTLGTSRLGGQDANFYLRIYQQKDSDQLSYSFLEAPSDVFRAWGGATVLVLTQGIHDDENLRSPDMQQAVAAASLPEQMNFFEEIYTAKMYYYYQGIVAANTGTLMGMMNLNYDLLFDNDIGTSFIDGVTGTD